VVAAKAAKHEERQKAHRKQEWEKAEGELGVFGDVWYSPPRLRADIQGVTVVVVEQIEPDGGGRQVIVQASAPGQIPTELAIQHKPTYIGRTPRLHDSNVDVAFEIKGPDDVVLALMSKEARNTFASLRERVSVERGVVSITAEAWAAGRARREHSHRRPPRPPHVD
jgi:hypothetical protein